MLGCGRRMVRRGGPIRDVGCSGLDCLSDQVRLRRRFGAWGNDSHDDGKRIEIGLHGCRILYLKWIPSKLPIIKLARSSGSYEKERQDCDDGSRLEENLVVKSSDEEIVKFPTQHATTKISGEDEDEPFMMLGSDLNTIKEDFSNDLDRQHLADENLYECLVETRIGLCGKKNMGSQNHVRQDYGATP
ncbi:hypothetical protein Tco_0906761 [Tanacetum coccineum]|uniref:Uncharacterized protein n=1 Tax=Tanacetum coccineum TaxID=301880 RepID=A0ABQ5CHC9_9ASTR